MLSELYPKIIRLLKYCPTHLGPYGHEIEMYTYKTQILCYSFSGINQNSKATDLKVADHQNGWKCKTKIQMVLAFMKTT